MELRRTHRRYVDEFLLTYRHQHLPQGQRWIAPLVDYMELHIWAETEQGGDIWNGRWNTGVLEDLLSSHPGHKIPTADFRPAIKWLQRLTSILQKAQRALYSARHIELTSKESRARRERFLTLRRGRKRKRAQTLYEAWQLPYYKPIVPRRGYASLLPTPTTILPTAQQIWIQYSRTIARVATEMGNQSLVEPPPAHRPPKPKRTHKLKLRRLRNILLLCR